MAARPKRRKAWRPPDSGPILAVDPGSRRVGLASCDAARTVPLPLATLPVARWQGPGEVADDVVAVARERGVGLIVVGRPLHLAGGAGASAGVAAELARAIADAAAPVPVVTWDERLTTVTATDRLRDAGMDGRRRRAVVDQMAALVLLESVLRCHELGTLYSTMAHATRVPPTAPIAADTEQGAPHGT